MNASQINYLLTESSNFMYRAFELTLKGEKPKVVHFIDVHQHDEQSQQKAWHVVDRTDLGRLRLHDHSVVRTINAESILSLILFVD